MLTFSAPSPPPLSPPPPPPKTDFEYECAWQGLASLKFNRWITRAELLEKGFRKFVVEFDQRLAANALGNDARPLSKETITKFLQDFGLEPEFGVHSNIRGLSGGQKVKLVLAAAMWNNPHLLIMDEPTNYLDRVSGMKEERGGGAMQ
jgi:elongation factor 3